MTEQRVAFVTGASRGIGRGCALHLAKAGFDVAIAARTMHDDERPTFGDVRVPGSLEATAAEIEARGAPRLCPCASIYSTGRAAALPSKPRSRTSGAGHNETAAAVGAGGWPLAYSLTKAAFNRMAAGVAKELKQYDVAVVNLEPGFIATEQMTLVLSQHGIDADNGLPVDVPGAVCAYIASHPTPMTFSGRTVDGPQMASWMQLLDATAFPHPYGPTNWGFPPRVPIGGHATGVESGIP
jgi:NAD(P)-dependent dehydrogenase (short-subunit alcohol dehydrogenase family)